MKNATRKQIHQAINSANANAEGKSETVRQAGMMLDSAGLYASDEKISAEYDKAPLTHESFDLTR
jgi:hypothetical protein